MDLDLDDPCSCQPGFVFWLDESKYVFFGEHGVSVGLLVARNDSRGSDGLPEPATKEHLFS